MEHEEKHKLLEKHKVFIDAFDSFMKVRFYLSRNCSIQTSVMGYNMSCQES